MKGAAAAGGEAEVKACRTGPDPGDGGDGAVGGPLGTPEAATEDASGMPKRLEAGAAVEELPAFDLRGFAGVFGSAVAGEMMESVAGEGEELSAFLRGAALAFSGDEAEASFGGGAAAVTGGEGLDGPFALDIAAVPAFATALEGSISLGEAARSIFGDILDLVLAGSCCWIESDFPAGA